MPFAIWCTNCPSETIVGQGVRFNAEKKKVGNYYSTPIYSFRMKHTDCGGWIEIRTDPKNAAYVVTEGARKRETGEDELREGDVVVRSEEEKERLRQDAFAALEVTIEGRQQETVDRDRINELFTATDNHWDDPYSMNKRLRSSFRVGRKQRERDHTVAEGIKDRFGLDIELLPENEEDSDRAAYVDFRLPDKSPDTAVRLAESSGLFSNGKQQSSTAVNSRSKHHNSHQAMLQKQVEQNTRAAVDPFLLSKAPRTSLLTGIKRKHTAQLEPSAKPTMLRDQLELGHSKSVLVDYDSD